MTKIFISYRRQDTKLIVGRIFERLKEKFGRDGVFMDIDSIPYGVDFRTHLDREVSQASAAVVLIGRGWADARDEKGQRRLDNPDDFVRIEIESMLRRDIPLVPVLIDGTPLPRVEQLPASFEPLLLRNGLQLDVARDFDTHMARLIIDLKRLAGRSGRLRRIREVLGAVLAGFFLMISVVYAFIMLVIFYLSGIRRDKILEIKGMFVDIFRKLADLIEDMIWPRGNKR